MEKEKTLEDLIIFQALGSLFSNCTDYTAFYHEIRGCDFESQYDDIMEKYEVILWYPHEGEPWEWVLEQIENCMDSMKQFLEDIRPLL